MADENGAIPPKPIPVVEHYKPDAPRRHKKIHKTPEFSIGLILAVAGIVCIAYGKAELGGSLLVLSGTAGASLVAKRAGKSSGLPLPMLFLALVVTAGCGTPGYVRADAIEDGLGKVCDRHDALCKNPEAMKLLGLDPAEADSFMTTTALLRAAVAEAKKSSVK